MTTVINSIGQKGVAGRDGTNGLGVSDVRESLIASPSFNLFRANKIDPSITWTRASEAAFVDRYGDNIKVSGDDVVHLLANSDDYRTGAGLTFPWVNNSLWTLDEDRNQSDPLGGTDASEITFTSTTGQTFGFMGNMLASTGLIFRVSIYVKVISGTLNKISFRNGSAGDIVDFPQTPSADWQRFNVVYTGVPSAEARFLFDAPSGCTVQVFRANITEGTKLHDPELIGDNRPVTIPVTTPVYRENQFGYLFEGEKTNLCPNSQEISDWFLNGGPVVSQNPDPDPYGDINTNTLITFAGSSSISITQTVVLTEGETYSVSFFAAASTGDVESLSVQLGGGAAQTVQVTNGYIRQSLQMVAGSQDAIAFNATAGTSGTAFILTGVQVESEQLSSYIATSDVTETRSADAVSFDGSLFPALNQPYTLQLCWRNVTYSESDDSVAVSGLVNGFQIRFEIVDGENQIIYRPATFSGTGVTGVQSSGEIIVTFDGQNSKIYIDGLYSRDGVNDTIPQQPETIVYLGSGNASQAQPLNASIKCFKMWSFEMTENEVKYISEVYNGNRYSDRG